MFVLQKLKQLPVIGLLICLSACAMSGDVQKLTHSDVTTSGPSLQEKIPLSDRWIVSVSEAQALVRRGAVVLDANGQTRGATPVTWQHFSQSRQPDRGKLIENDAELSQRLRSLGISSTQPVLVLGKPLENWGEEGRIVWMLRSLGQTQAYIVDGGRQTLAKVENENTTAGDFSVKRDRSWTLTKAELKQQLGQLKILDSRERREYDGETPYGETRGGHIPGAQHLYFKELLDQDGHLLSHGELIAKLEALDIAPSDPIVVYCTGGIRSSWLTAVLVSLGYNAKNYPGSMWEWSADSAEEFPLVKQ